MRLGAIFLAWLCAPLTFSGPAAAQTQSQSRNQTQTPIWVRPGYYKQLTPDRWKDRVAAMLKSDAETFPAPQGIVFVGSATIAGWDLRHYFPQYRTVNRGIGGSLISEATYYADQLVIPLNPSTIVFYSGDNDTAYGMTPDMVAAEFRKFVAKIHTSLPRTQIVVIPIRPSIARLAVWDAVKASNAKLEEIADSDPQLSFADIVFALLTPDGKPRRDLLGDDLHHLNEDGFDVISPVVRVAIKEAEARYWRGGSLPQGQ